MIMESSNNYKMKTTIEQTVDLLNESLNSLNELKVNHCLREMNMITQNNTETEELSLLGAIEKITK